MTKTDKVLKTMDDAFERSKEFTKGERLTRLEDVYKNLRKEMSTLDFDKFPKEFFKQAMDSKQYMKLFWETSDSETSNRAYHIRVKTLGLAEQMYPEEDIQLQVMSALKHSLKALSDEFVVENEESLQDINYLEELLYDFLQNEERNTDSL